MTIRTLALCVLATTLSLHMGCKDKPAEDKPVQQPESGAVAAPGEAAPAAPAKKNEAKVTRLSGPELSGSVLGVVGLRSMSDAAAMVRSVGGRIAPGALPPDAVSMVLEHLKRDLGFTDISWVSQDKPVRIVLAADPTFGDKSDLLVLPISDQSRLEASLKPGSRDGAGDHLAAYEHALAKRFLDVAKGHLVISQHPDIFAAVKGDLNKDILAWSPSSSLSIHLDMKRLNARYKDAIQGAKAMLQGALQGQGAGAKPDPQIAHLLAVVEGASHLDVTLGESDGMLHLKLGGEAVEGTLPSALIGATGGKTCGLSGLGRADSWLGICDNLDLREVKELKKMSDLQGKNIIEALSLPPDAVAGLTAILDQLTALSTGDSLVSAYADGSFPLAVDAVSSVSDAAAYHKASMGVLDLLIPHIWTALSESMKEQGKPLPPAKINTVDELVQMAAPFAAAYGLKLKVNHESRDGAKLESLVVDLDWKLLKEQAAKEPGDAQKLDLLRQVIGDKLSVAAAYKGTTASFSFGPNGVDNALSLASGAKGDGAHKALAEMGSTSSVAAVVSLGKLLDSLRSNPAIAPNLPPAQMLPTGKDLTFRSASDGTYVSAELSLPIDLVGTIMAMTAGP